jgi:hypothetical protein
LENLDYNLSSKGMRPSQKKLEQSYKSNHQQQANSSNAVLEWSITIVTCGLYSHTFWHLFLHLLHQKQSGNGLLNIKRSIRQNESSNIAKETILTFPDFSQEFEMHTDASKLPL